MKAVATTTLLGLFAMSTLMGCDEGAGVTWVNRSDIKVCVYFGDDVDILEVDLAPMTQTRLGVIVAVWRDVVVVRNVEGEIRLREELTWDELEDQDSRYEIPASVGEGGGATSGRCPGDD